MDNEFVGIRKSYLRPEVLELKKVKRIIKHKNGSSRPVYSYECEEMDSLMRELNDKGCSGSIVIYKCEEKNKVPTEALKVFDYVIFSKIPDHLWDDHGVTPTSRLSPGEYIPVKQNSVCFYAGFDIKYNNHNEDQFKIMDNICKYVSEMDMQTVYDEFNSMDEDLMFADLLEYSNWLI